MSLPSISAICVTFGRVQYLQNAVQCFLNQKYDGERELIVLNTCTQQKLVWQSPSVRIINLDRRPSSLGVARNMAIEQARGEIMVVWDDDDFCAANHLENFGKRFADRVDWVWLDKEYYSEGGKILKIDAGQMPCCAFRKTAWEKVGKYSELTVGEDRQIIGKLTAELPGVKTELTEEEISFIYCWGNGAFHVSGEGLDRAGQRPAHIRIEEDLNRRIRGGLEKTGDIRLVPQLKITPEEMITRFRERTMTPTESKPAVCIVELGRFGDIANLLPVCRHIAENYRRPHLMVSREFASILEGVSYVVPEIVDMPNDQLLRAMQLSKKKFPHVLRGQIWGKGHNQDKKCASYNHESWRELGFSEQFFDPAFKLVFDLRNPGREEGLWRTLKKTDKPALLVQVTNSVSSPYPFGKQLLELLKARLGDVFELIDLAPVRAERIYDLIGLIDRAAGVISIDSAMLHLAAASTTPVIAIVNPMGWGGSQLRCNCVSRMTYTEVEKDVEILFSVIMTTIPKESPAPVESDPVRIKPALKRRIFHAVERHDGDDTISLDRKKVAWASWDPLYAANKLIPAHYWNYKRDATSIGDRRALPFFKDVLAHAGAQAGEHDIIVFTNDDNWLHPDLIAKLEFHVAVYGAVSLRRCEFKSRLRMASPEELAKRGEHHLGRDLFAFTNQWLSDHWDKIPDYILGASIWDLAMASLIRKFHGIVTTRNNLKDDLFPAELPRGLIAHQYHVGQWTKESATSPAEKWNRNLFFQWAKNNLPDLKFTNELAI